MPASHLSARTQRRVTSRTAPSTFAALAAILAIARLPRAGAAYTPLKTYSGSSFFDSWNFYGHYDNLTNGDIDFVNRTDSSDLAYINGAGNAIIKMDNTSTVLYPNKRRSVRIQSQDTYPIGSLWIFDFLHVPYGCSVWPAAWSQATVWPQGGEIDTFEGVNLVQHNQYALHTTNGCSISNSSSSNFTGTLTYGNCDTSANANSGCTILDPRTSSYGAAFASNGGGVYATEFSKNGISVWFFPRANVPSDLSSNSSAPNPTGWGEPVARYGGSSCDVPTFFAPQHLIIDITACGDWAGHVTNTTGCPLTTNLCYTSFVLNSSNYDTAYFEIPSIRVFSNADLAANSSASATGMNNSSSTSAPGSNAPKSAAERISVGESVAGAVIAGVAMLVGGWALL
ncbi:glycoside hydrolase family 16 protein [Rhodotorula toruloides]|uniref:Glycoside hydrolase family 16 protein n=1 Tax=Rhodotorula toruloides TaxID=5286 RepID=A0A511KQ61_RHOTO|nr:glycoside hydrolase family 16 protein [Rhodotorula toruloides]